ncbi:gliding motility protein GldC [Cytophagales bacterium LB-30]|uniref:Gliding motility protein GldC n=1 Tax=Shiella aurantiaca TaxID=3058365 RepID=A0ABT8F4D0_9BACT|nr:gliding motility protein GldC [Shiella aurantiaca]MDN4165310.1 gliding motility protein GldC [Shiella aurantiaca]
MKKSEISFEIALDKDNIPEKITWNATDKDGNDLSETKAISIALWDEQSKNTLRIDLWTKEMRVDEMKRFYIDCLGGLGQSLLNSTGDEYMANEMSQLCERLVKHVEKELRG